VKTSHFRKNEFVTETMKVMEQLKGIIAALLLLASTTSFAQTDQYNPFKKFDKESNVLTLSNGRYNEFHDQDSIVLIGAAIFNTRTMKVVGLVEYDTLYSEATLEPNVVSRWLSPDPLAAKYPNMSPYAFVENSPMMLIDPDGRDSRVAIKKNENGGGIITITTIVHVYGENAQNVADYSNNLMESLNTTGTHADQDGNDWTVVFDVKFEVNQSLSEYDPNLEGLSYHDLKDVAGQEGIMKGDNFVCADCLPVAGALEHAFHGGSLTVSPARTAAVHGVFHNLGFKDRYSLEGDVMAREIPSRIDQIHFDDAARTILKDMRAYEKYPTEYDADVEGIQHDTRSQETFEEN